MTADLFTIPKIRRPEICLPGLGSNMPVLIGAAQREQTTVSAGLRYLYDRLIDPLKTIESAYAPTDAVDVSIAQPGGVDAETAAVMLDWGYCSHYYSGEGKPELPPEPPILRARAHTLVANAYIGDHTVVLGTLQVVMGPTVPALSLFDPGDNQGGGVSSGPNGYPTVAELRRFAVNPLLEIATNDQELRAALRGYRSDVYRALFTRSLDLLQDAGVEIIYGIATPEIYRFFTRSGMPMRPVIGARWHDTAELRQLQERFAGYWRPNSPEEQRPALYQIFYPADELVTA